MHKLSEDESGFWFATKRMWQGDLGGSWKASDRATDPLPLTGGNSSGNLSKDECCGWLGAGGTFGDPARPSSPAPCLAPAEGTEPGGRGSMCRPVASLKLLLTNLYLVAAVPDCLNSLFFSPPKCLPCRCIYREGSDSLPACLPPGDTLPVPAAPRAPSPAPGTRFQRRHPRVFGTSSSLLTRSELLGRAHVSARPRFLQHCRCQSPGPPPFFCAKALF